jgi:hypothetical protein
MAVEPVASHFTDWASLCSNSMCRVLFEMVMKFQVLTEMSMKMTPLGCCALQSDRYWPLFQMCLLPPSSKRSTLLVKGVSTSVYESKRGNSQKEEQGFPILLVLLTHLRDQEVVYFFASLWAKLCMSLVTLMHATCTVTFTLLDKSPYSFGTEIQMRFVAHITCHLVCVTLGPSGNYMYHLISQSVTLHFVFVCFVWLSE